MRSLLIMMVVCLALAGCGGGAANTNTMNTATVEVNPADAAPTTNTNTSLAYPQETIEAFLKACESAGSNRTFCTCVFEKIQARYTLEEFAAIEEQIQSGKPSKDFIEFSEKARAECEK